MRTGKTEIKSFKCAYKVNFILFYKNSRKFLVSELIFRRPNQPRQREGK